MTGTKSCFVRLATIAAVAVLAATSCSSDPQNTAPPPVSALATTTTLGPEATVLIAYRSFWDAYLAASDPMNPEDPRLAEHATGEELTQLVSSFLAYKSAGEVFRGTIDLAPRVVDFAADKATLRDCYASHIIRYDAATGVPKGPGRSERTLVTATVVREDSAWKVSSLKREGDGCAVGA